MTHLAAIKTGLWSLSDKKVGLIKMFLVSILFKTNYVLGYSYKQWVEGNLKHSIQCHEAFLQAAFLIINGMKLRSVHSS